MRKEDYDDKCSDVGARADMDGVRGSGCIFAIFCCSHQQLGSSCLHFSLLVIPTSLSPVFVSSVEIFYTLGRCIVWRVGTSARNLDLVTRHERVLDKVPGH